MTQILGYDSTSGPSVVPAGAQAVFGYGQGYWPNAGAMAAAFPQAYHFSIAIAARYDGDCLDIENGDANPPDGPGWVARQWARGIARPMLYANLSTMPAVVSYLHGAGIPLSRVFLWQAHYTMTAHVCQVGCPAGGNLRSVIDADLTQFSDAYMGRNLDASLIQPWVFGGSAPTPAAPSTVQEDDMTTLHREPQHGGGVIAVNAPFVRWLPDQQSVASLQWRIQYVEKGDPTINAAPDGWHNAFVWVGPEVGGAAPSPANHLSGIVS